MSRNQLTALAVVAVLLVGAIVITNQSDESPLTFQSQIGGNSEMLPSPTAYTVIALPQNFKTEPNSQKLLQEIADGALGDLPKKTAIRVYLEGHEILNNLKLKTLPAVLVLNGETPVYKASGPNVQNISDDLDGAIRRCRVTTCVPTRVNSTLKNLCPNCPPKQDPPKADTPKRNNEPELKDILPNGSSQPASSPEKNILILAAIAGAVGAVVRYFSN